MNKSQWSKFVKRCLTKTLSGIHFLVGVGIVLCVLAGTTQAQVTYTRLKSFGDDVGTSPASLMEGSDGKLYGVCSWQPPLVFRLNKDGSDFTILKTLTPLEGKDLCGLVEVADGRLCGRAKTGGPHGSGTLFCLEKDGSSFQIIHDFFAEVGNNCFPDETGAIHLRGGDNCIYGTFSCNLTNGFFRCSLDGSLSVINPWVCVKVPNDVGLDVCIYPYGMGSPASVIEGGDGRFYGATTDGGESYCCPIQDVAGVIFSMNRGGGDYSVLHRFPAACSGTACIDQMAPRGLCVADGNVYGVTKFGGRCDLAQRGYGTLYKLSGGAYVALNAFSGTDGKNPQDAPTMATIEGDLDSTGLYGTTLKGGLYDDGVLYRYLMTGGFSVLRNWGGRDDEGIAPVGSLFKGSDGALYGITAAGGLAGGGTVYKLTSDSTGTNNGVAINVIKHFGCAHGSRPAASLIEGRDGYLYGTTIQGGGLSWGTVYRVKKDGTGYRTIKLFNGVTFNQNADGWGMIFAPVMEASDGFLYGTTYDGGTSSMGSIFRVNKDGTSYQMLKSFSWSDGANPQGGLVEISPKVLFGTTLFGGAFGNGTVYRIESGGGSFTVLHDFGSVRGDGIMPGASLIIGSDNWCYGTTSVGGTNGGGTVFRINNSSGYEILHHFSTSGGDGWYLTAPLLEGSDGSLYGTTEQGGMSTLGTIFKVNRDGTGYRILKHFGEGGGDGQTPQGALAEGRDGTLYGSTKSGGSSGKGVVYMIRKDGTGYRNLHDFGTGEGDGLNPWAGLVLGSDGAFYGTTYDGGVRSNGLIYRIVTPSLSPVIVTEPESLTVGSGVNASFSVTATNGVAFQYQWRFNGVPIPNTTNASFTVTNAQCSNAGDYDAIITNAFGSVTSAVATLTVAINGLEAKLTAGDAGAYDDFGHAVSVSSDGNTMLIGAVFGDLSEDQVDCGKAYVFTRSGSRWIQQAELAATDATNGDWFGVSVSLSRDGNIALVGQSNDDPTYQAYRQGAYVFVRNGTNWSQQAKLTATNSISGDWFGWSVALSDDGTTAIVGADGFNAWQGRAYVFARNGTNWHQQSELTATDGTEGSFFGVSVSLSSDGNSALVGACDRDTWDGAGRAYVFVRSGTIWSQQTKLTASDGEEGENFGVSVSLSRDGNTALIGACYDNTAVGDDVGSAYVFVRSGASWSEQAKLTASDGAAIDYFGHSVSVSANGNTALVGSYLGDTAAGVDAGSAYVFARNGTTWSQQTKLTVCDGAADDWFGFSVFLSGDGNTALIGAVLDDTAAGENAGSAYVFSLGSSPPTAPTITTTSPLPSGTVGSPYSQTLQAMGGSTPYAWSVVSGSLPTGLSLNSTNGLLSGTPSTANTYNFTIRCTGSNSLYANKPFSLIIGVGTEPRFTQQPQDLIVPQWDNATFSVQATGGGTLSYQWRFNGTNIAGGTASTYTRTNVQPIHAGSYAVVVTNNYGSRTSTMATLMVVPPGIVGQWPGFARGNAYGVFVTNNLAYLASDFGGLVVIDVNNPANPVRVGGYDTSGIAHGVAVSGNYACVADGSAGLQVIDVSDPANPVRVGGYNTSGTAYGVAVSGNYAIVADDSAGLQVIDVNNPANPVWVGGYDTSGTARGVAVAGNFAYVADGNAGLQVIDVSNPANPVWVGGYDTSGTARGVVVSGNHAYVADFATGLQVIDVGNPASPLRVGGYNTSGTAYGVAVSGNYAYVADSDAGLQVINVSNPTSPARMGGYAIIGDAQLVAVSGNYAYVADSDAGLQVIDMSNPTRPGCVGGYDTFSYASGVAVAETYAYVADFYDGLQVIDVSNPTNPVRVGGCDTSGYAVNVAVSGKYAYVADYNAGLQVIDVNNPANPVWVGGYDTSGTAQGVAVAGNFAYVADGNAGLQVINVNNPANPVWVGGYDTSGTARGVAVAGNFAYVADGNAGLQVIDVSNPTSPLRVGGYDTAGTAYGVAVSGEYAYVADYTAGLQVIDVNNPANPVWVGGYDTSGTAQGVAVSGNYACVAVGPWGLAVIQVYSLLHQPPQIVEQPQSRTNITGTTATFTVTASGTTPINYQWIKYGTNWLTDGGNVTGATTKNLTLANVQDIDTGSYSVVVTNLAGSMKSSNATLTVIPPLKFTITVLAGSNLILGGSGGSVGDTYYVLTSTNVALGMTNWVSVATNTFKAGGTFTVTNTVNPAGKARYFRLYVP